MQQFHSKEFGSLDIILIDGTPYFPASECARILGYRNPRDAIAKHCRLDGVAKCDGVSATVNQYGKVTEQTVEKTYISEGNLYRLIMRSKLPSAERFEIWVCDEILPTIRKHGAYITADTLDELLRSPKFAEILIQKLEAERTKVSQLEEVALELAPKALYCDLVLQSKNAIPLSLIAKDYGMSAVVFNRLLHGLGIQYRCGGAWILYQKYADKGYTQSRTVFAGNRHSVMHTRWTQNGRLFLYETLKNYGIKPLLEVQLSESLSA
jgi:prophage antirepressor-like protein